jgi:hypothetical protein
MKKLFYILCTIFLGILLATIAHALVEIWYIQKFLSEGLIPKTVVFLGSRCYLPFYVQIAFLLSGVIGGYLLGQNWWRIIYVEHRHWKCNKK